jgi:hypothetical protein
MIFPDLNEEVLPRVPSGVRRRCVLHFGMHKTGSSSIQASLFRKPLGEGFHYVDFGVDNPTGPILNMFQAPELRYKHLVARGARLGYEAFLAERGPRRERLSAELSGARARTLIISAEGLTLLSESELASFRDYIGQYVGAIDAFAYVRRPKEFMESMFQQQVKGRLGSLDLRKLYPVYRQRFEKFDWIFGVEHVHYRLFDAEGFPGGCVVQDFCGCVGVPLAKDQIVRVNEGLSRNAVALLYVYRKYARAIGSDRYTIGQDKLLVEELAKLRGPKLRFSWQVVEPVLKENESDLGWMEARLGVSLREIPGPREPDAIHDEAGLLSLDQGALDWLGTRVMRQDGGSGTLGAESRDGATGDEQRPGGQLGPRSLFRYVRETSPELFEGISNAEALRLIEGVLRAVRGEVHALGDGALRIAGLGRFRRQGSAVLWDGPSRVTRARSFSPASREEAVALSVRELQDKVIREKRVARWLEEKRARRDENR